jgi:hypothetical protein
MGWSGVNMPRGSYFVSVDCAVLGLDMRFLGGI